MLSKRHFFGGSASRYLRDVGGCSARVAVRGFSRPSGNKRSETGERPETGRRPAPGAISGFHFPAGAISNRQ